MTESPEPAAVQTAESVQCPACGSTARYEDAECPVCRDAFATAITGHRALRPGVTP